MVAYSFKKRFAEPILEGRKSRTIRAVGKRVHAKPGDVLQLYIGMRTKHCRLIAAPTCTYAGPIVIDWTETIIMAHGGRILDLEGFAQADGFANLADMRAFWKREHAGVERFEGVMIRWTPLHRAD